MEVYLLDRANVKRGKVLREQRQCVLRAVAIRAVDLREREMLDVPRPKLHRRSWSRVAAKLAA